MYIVSTGMVSPVGLNAEASCAAMRAGISAFEELPYSDNSGEPIVGAVVPGYTLDTRHFGNRLVKMLAAAVTECLDKTPQLSTEGIPLLVALAEAGRPGFPADLAENIINKLQAALGVNFHPVLSRVVSSGHTSGFEALAIAREIMKDKDVPSCLICGVDSYLRAGSLLWLDQHWRLKTEENSDGVIPGEAAAAVLVCTRQFTSSATSVQLTGLGFGTEPAPVMTEEPLLGLGLTEASKGALSEVGIQMHQIGFRLSDVTGESYGFREQALVVGRLLRVHREGGYPIWHASENIGDTGAAAGIVQIILSFYAFLKNYAPGDVAMCFASSETGRRAVALLASTKHGKVGT